MKNPKRWILLAGFMLIVGLKFTTNLSTNELISIAFGFYFITLILPRVRVKPLD